MTMLQPDWDSKLRTYLPCPYAREHVVHTINTSLISLDWLLGNDINWLCTVQNLNRILMNHLDAGNSN